MLIPNLFNTNCQSISLANLLVVGCPGSGRFNFINRYLTDLTHAYSPGDLRVILVDPTGALFSDYSNSPYLLFGIISQADKIDKMINWLDREVDTRLNDNSNKKTNIVLIIDELADLVVHDLEKRQVIEKLFDKIASNSQKVNIYMVISTSRVDEIVMTDNLRQCFNWRLAFKLENKNQSILAIDEPGAESLSLPGSCILKNIKAKESIDLKMPFISEEEIRYLSVRQKIK